MTSPRWVWVHLTHPDGSTRACFGIVTYEGRIIDTAPYCRKLLGPDWCGMPERSAAEILTAKGATFRPLDDPEQELVGA